MTVFEFYNTGNWISPNTSWLVITGEIHVHEYETQYRARVQYGRSLVCYNHDKYGLHAYLVHVHSTKTADQHTQR